MDEKMRNLYKLDKLFENCKTCDNRKSKSPEKVCKGCQVYKEIREIGQSLENQKPAKPRISVSTYIEERYMEKKSGQEIAKYFDMSLTKLNNWINKNRTAIDRRVNKLYGPLTKREIATAAKNGIKEDVASYRIQYLHWDRKQAITVPVKKRNSSGWIKVKKTANMNGITYSIYIKRIKNGLTPEQASTMPIKDEEVEKEPSLKSGLTDGQINYAAAKGIGYKTIVNRLNKKWTVKDAITIPIGTSRKEFYEKMYG